MTFFLCVCVRKTTKSMPQILLNHKPLFQNWEVLEQSPFSPSRKHMTRAETQHRSAAIANMIQTRTFLLSFVFFVFSFAVVFAQTTSPVTNCTLKSNTSCEECLKIVSCLWCISSQKCIDYPVKSILPSHSVCPLSDARWGMCWMNFQTLIITISVIAGVIIIAIFVCCFCCCKCENIGSRRNDERTERQAHLRKFRQEERKAEMKKRHDEMRLKYGLTKDNPYSRFENS